MRCIDCCVHPAIDINELRQWLPEPYRGRRLPPVGDKTYTLPIAATSATVPAGYAADPSLTASFLFDACGIESAVLVPLTLGWRADTRHGAVIAGAMNQWLATTWLSPEHNRHGRYYGSIRVFPGEVDHAIAEIERWAPDQRFVQVVVATHSVAPYGDQRYWPIWEAAERHHLPVLLQADGGGGIEFPPSMVGYPSHFIEYNTLLPSGGILHVISLICQGAFERFPSLVVVLADGGFDLLMPLLWRLNKEWRQTRFEVPWIERQPSDYLLAHVRVLLGALDGPGDATSFSKLLELDHIRELLMYGSRYPYWDMLEPSEALLGQPDRLREKVLYEKANELYRFRTTATG